MDEAASLVIRVLSEQVETSTRRLAELENQSRQTEKQVKKLATVNFRAVGAELAAFGFGIATLKREVEAAVGRWVEFDTVVKRSGSVASFTSGEFRKLRKDTLLLSAALGVDATKAAEGLYEAFQADIPKDNAIEFLSTATKTSIGGITTVTSAVNSLTNVINAYGLDVGRAEEISDKLFTTVLYGKASFDQLGASLSGATVPAAAMGVKFEEVLAMITQITSQGTSTSEAITQIERSIQALINPSEEMVRVFRQLGVEGGRQAIAQYGLVGTLEEVRKAYAGNDAALVKATGSVVALQAVLGTTGSKLADTKQALDQVTNSAGATEKAFKANSDTVGASLNSIKSSVTLLIEQMENSLGIIAKFSEGLKGAVILAQRAASVLDNTNFTEDTNQALNTAKMGGAAAALALEQQIAALEAKQKMLDVGRQRGDILTGLGEENGGFDLFGSGGRSFLSRAIDKNEKELSTLRAQYDQLDVITKSAAQALQGVGDIQSDIADGSVLPERGAIAQERLLAGLDEQIAKQEEIAKQKKDLETATKAAADAEDKKTADLLVAAEKQLALDEKHKQQLIGVAGVAKDLATTEIEKLREKQALIREAMATTDESARLDSMVGQKAIENLDQQIALLEKKQEVGGAAGGGGGGATAMPGISAFGIADSLPEISNPFESDNLFDQLARDEEEVKKSYLRRRDAILRETRLTEEQRLSLLNEASEKYKTIMADADRQRMKDSLQIASDTFGDLAKVAGVFGRKGAGIAKGFAIMQATIDMTASAIAAYKATVGTPIVGPYIAPVAAAGALAFGAQNIAKIRSTEYSGEYEHGGLIPAGMRGLVGEAGPELITGPAVVTSARTTDSMLRGSEKRMPRVEVRVYNYGNQKVETRTSENGDVQLVEFIAGRAADKFADDILKGGTRAAKSIEQTYNQSRGGGRRR